MDKIINFQLLANPANWLIIFLIAYLSALLANMVYTAATTGQVPFPLPTTLANS